jgi:hypothetical protein
VRFITTTPLFPKSAGDGSQCTLVQTQTAKHVLVTSSHQPVLSLSDIGKKNDQNKKLANTDTSAAKKQE